MKTQLWLLFFCLAVPSLALAEPVLVRGTVTNGAIDIEYDGIMHQATLGGLIMDRLTSESAILIQGFWFPHPGSSGVEETTVGPYSFAMNQNVPNPFNPRTTINVVVPGGTGSSAQTSLAIYDIQGRLVRTLAHGLLTAGLHGFVWDGRNDDGVSLASGVYYARCFAGAFTARKQLILLK